MGEKKSVCVKYEFSKDHRQKLDIDIFFGFLIRFMINSEYFFKLTTITYYQKVVNVLMKIAWMICN